jgi:hypothetical protein
MFQNLACRPLSRSVRSELLGSHPGNGCRNLLLQFLQPRVHAGYLPFSFFRLECCAKTKLIQRYHRKDVMKTASLPALSTRASLSRNLKSQKQRASYTRLSIALVAILLGLLTACSDSTPPAETKPEVKGPELLTARSAFQKLYIAARGWQPDAKPYRLESVPTSEGNGQDGKWAIWRCSFASAAQRSAKTFTWSGSAADGSPTRGVSPSAEDSYSATNSSTQVFDMSFLKIDSDQAFTTAQKHGGEKITEKTPTAPVIYILDWNHNTSELTWHVVYGSRREGAPLTVAVNASTGEFIRVEK